MPWEFLMSSWWTNVKLQKPCAVSFARRFSLSPQQAEAARVWNKQSAAVFVCLMEDMLTTWVYHRRKDMNGQVEYFFLGMIPLLRSCQHVFCLSCISRALANKAECPLCREEMHASHLRRCQPIQALVDEVQVPRRYVCRRSLV